MFGVKQREAARSEEELAQPVARAPAPWVDALSLAEGGLLADVGVILELVRIFLPIAGVAFSLLVPVPFALLMLRRGLKPTLLAVVVGALLISLITGPHYGWRMGGSALVGLALGFAMRARLRPCVCGVGWQPADLALALWIFLGHGLADGGAAFQHRGRWGQHHPRRQ